MLTDQVNAEIEAMSDGMLLLELTGDASFLTDEELLAELEA